jgi:hypothetical protein
LAFKLQTPVNYPEESIRHPEHGESLKSRINQILFIILCSELYSAKRRIYMKSISVLDSKPFLGLPGILFR